jgi:hypothetical protein
VIVNKFVHAAVAALVGCAMGAPFAASSPAPGLTDTQRAVFCGHEGHDEATAPYSTAVLVEIRRREATGRSTQQALEDMRREYCGAAR